MNQSICSHLAILTTVLIFGSTISVFAQIKVGDNPTTLNPDALLEIETTDKGLLLPRVALTSTTDAAPLSAHVQGMIVYNTADVPAPGDVTTGYYYNDGTQWVRLAEDNSIANEWMITGNAGTDEASDFIGTTDAVAFVTRTDNTERMRVTSTGNVGIGSASPTEKLQVEGNINFSGALMPDNQAGSVGQALLSGGAGAPPTWGSPIAAFGDVKTGIQATDHGGWVKLDGRLTSSLTSTQQLQAAVLGIGSNLPDASNAVLMQNGLTLGNVSGSNTKTIAQNQLPNVTLGGSTSTAGAHTHNLRVTQDANLQSGVQSGVATDNNNAGTSNAQVVSGGAHTHTITTTSINGNVTQQQLDITPKALSINVFIYLGT
jgi:hypothetical protein